MKKKYNPFKMKSGWVGLFIMLGVLLLGLILYLTSSSSMALIWFEFTLIPSIYLLNLITPQLTSSTPQFLQIIYFSIATIMQLVLGFLLGWGIHILIRRYKK